jgi:hypothetical protein
MFKASNIHLMSLDTSVSFIGSHRAEATVFIPEVDDDINEESRDPIAA